MKKILILTALAIMIAGVFVPLTVCAEQRPWNVDVVLHCGDRSYRYNLSGHIERLSATSRENRGVYMSLRVKKQICDQLCDSGFTRRQALCYVLPDFEKVLEQIDKQVYRKVTDSTVRFDGNFTYTEGQDGKQVDVDKLCLLLFGGKTSVEVPVAVTRCVDKDSLKQITQSLSKFTTTFYKSTANRCHNIRLATEKINGTVIKSGESFSFNKVVGDRTGANGFLDAKVILNGSYTDGTGGGVCQVSTTLYNAVLLAGLEVKESHCHTLIPSYVKAGFDAMVAYPTADLCFVNNTPYTVYISGKVNNKTVTFEIFGKPSGYTFKRESEELQRTKFSTMYIVDKAKYPELQYTDQQLVVQNGSDGVKCVSYLVVYKGDRVVEKRQVRRSTYAKVDRIVAQGDLPPVPEQEEQLPTIV